MRLWRCQGVVLLAFRISNTYDEINSLKGGNVVRKTNIIFAAAMAMIFLFSPKIARAEDEIIARYKHAVVKIERDQIGEKKDWLGSGVFYTPTRVITNAHIVGKLPDTPREFREVYSDSDLARARFWIIFRGKKYPATFVGRDPTVDLAILEIEQSIEGIIPAPLGDSNDVHVGDDVYVFGNPFGMENTVTSGIVTGTEKLHGTLSYEDYIQTQAPINPGNSGGPMVLKRNGMVVGIVNSGIPNANNMGYAIPINIFKDIEQEMKGTVRRAWLGINFPKTGELKEATGFQGLLSIYMLTGINDVAILEHTQKEVFEEGGVLITDVRRTLNEPVFDPLTPSAAAREDLRSPAYKSGIVIGDVIKELGGKPVRTSRDLMYALFQLIPYQMTTITVMRFSESAGTKEELNLPILPMVRIPESIRDNLY